MACLDDTIDKDLKDLKRARLFHKSLYPSLYIDFISKHFPLDPQLLDLDAEGTLERSFVELSRGHRTDVIHDANRSNDGSKITEQGPSLASDSELIDNRGDRRSSEDENSEELFTRMPSLGLGLFEIRVFQPAWCERLVQELDRFQAWADGIGLAIDRPNSMNKFGVILNMLPGFNQFFDSLIYRHLRPLAGVLFPSAGGNSLDSHHTFTVEYRGTGEEGEAKLGFHVDDAEVTLNICLGAEFEGGDLYFRGQRCNEHVNTPSLRQQIMMSSTSILTAPSTTDASQTFQISQTSHSQLPDSSSVDARAIEISEEANVRHRKHFGLLHMGRNRHGAHEVTSGRRVNLIVWMRSSTFRQLSREVGGKGDDEEDDDDDDGACPEYCGMGAQLRSDNGDFTSAYLS